MCSWDILYYFQSPLRMMSIDGLLASSEQSASRSIVKGEGGQNGRRWRWWQRSRPFAFNFGHYTSITGISCSHNEFFDFEYSADLFFFIRFHNGTVQYISVLEKSVAL